MNQLTLVVIGGLPLSGKTTLGRALEKSMDIHFCDIDALRAAAFGLPTRREYEAQWTDTDQGAKWAKERMRMAYQLLHDGAVDIALGTGQSLIVAATYSRTTSQEFVKGLAEKHGAFVRPILCRLIDETQEEIERRMARDKDEEYIYGTATWNDYLEVKSRFEPLDEAGVFSPEGVLVVDTSAPLTDERLSEIVAFIGA